MPHPLGKKWRLTVMFNRWRKTKVFATKAEAGEWEQDTKKQTEKGDLHTIARLCTEWVSRYGNNPT